MFYRHHTLIAVLSIALQAGDSVVALVGHDHAAHGTASGCKAGCKPSEARAAEHGHCHHGHCHAPAPASRAPGSRAPASTTGGDSGSVPAHDCSICRHFSQPVAPLSPALELAAGERAELLAQLHVLPSGAAVRIAHNARGPPSFGA